MKMKSTHLTLLIVLASFTGLSCQIIVPPKINFIGLTENWSYISKDSNFIKSPGDKWSTPYWGHFPIDIKVLGTSVVILENCVAQSPYGFVDGSLVHSLNVNNGNLNWIFHNNSYVGNKHREDYAESKIYLNENSDIEIMGYKAIDTLDKTKAAFGFYSNPVTKTLDVNTGKLKKEIFGNSTLKGEHNAVGFSSTKIVRNHNNDLFQAGFRQTLDTPIDQYNEFVMYNIDEKNVIDTTKQYIYPYKKAANSNIDPKYYTLFEPLNADTLIFLLNTRDYGNLIDSPVASKLVWLNISDKENIRVDKEIDIIDEYYRPQDGKTEPAIQTIDQNIFIHQLMIPINPPIDTKWFTWLLWLDKNGTEIAKVPYIYDKGEQYIFVKVIGIKNDELYLSISKESTTAIGMDILKIKKNTQIATKVGSISTQKNNNFKIGNFSAVKMLPDNNILVGLGMDYEYQADIITQIQYYYSFKLEDLGIISSTVENDNKLGKFKIFPNPSTDLLKIESSEIYDEIVLISELGMRHHIIGSSDTIDLTNFASGWYVIELLKNGLSLGRQKLIKIR